jgi:hypothetical protein
MSKIEVINRWAMFREDYKNYAPPEIIDAIDDLHERLLPAFFGDQMAEKVICDAFDRLGVEYLLADQFEIERDEIVKLPIYNMMLALEAYAYYGLIDRETLIFMNENYIFPVEGLDDHALAKRLVEQFGEMFDPENSNQQVFVVASKIGLKSTLRAARTRLAIDTPDMDVMIKTDDLALLVRMSLKSIQNLMAPDKKLHHTGKKGAGIPVGLIRDWLKKTKKVNFLQSLLNSTDDNIENENQWEIDPDWYFDNECKIYSLGTSALGHTRPGTDRYQRLAMIEADLVEGNKLSWTDALNATKRADIETPARGKRLFYLGVTKGCWGIEDDHGQKFQAQFKNKNGALERLTPSEPENT